MRQSRGRAGAGLLAATLLVSGLAGCSSSSGSSSRAVASAEPTPISRLNTAAMRLDRGSFCTKLSQVAVDDAVGGTAGRGEAWSNGDKAAVEDGADGADGVDDVVHEYGCRWTRGTTTARAWVFARALSDEQARAVVAQTSRRRGCSSVSGDGFGSVSQRQTCTLPDGSTRVRLAGLFTDTWLSCELEAGSDVPSATLASRTDAWCVQVANAVNTTR